jgi:hypothetical protein
VSLFGTFVNGGELLREGLRNPTLEVVWLCIVPAAAANFATTIVFVPNVE